MMHETKLELEVAALFDRIHGGATVRAMTMPRWRIYQEYLQEYGPLPECLDEVPVESFSPFVSACEERGMGDGELHLLLAGLRTIFTLAGWKPGRFAGLVAPRRRVRVANTARGKYGFALVRKDG
jgi:hypothetical protein